MYCTILPRKLNTYILYVCPSAGLRGSPLEQLDLTRWKSHFKLGLCLGNSGRPGLWPVDFEATQRVKSANSNTCLIMSAELAHENIYPLALP